MSESTSSSSQYDIAFANTTSTVQSGDLIPLFRGGQLYSLTDFSTNSLLGPTISVGNTSTLSNLTIRYYTVNASTQDGTVSISGGTSGTSNGATYKAYFGTYDLSSAGVVLVPTASSSATNLNIAASIGYVKTAIENVNDATLTSLKPQVFTATAGQTTFQATYVVGQISVYLNGILLNPNSEYTATTGNTIVIASTITINAQDVLIVMPLVASSQLYTMTRSLYSYTASSANQPSVTVNSGYTQGQLNVYLNGMLLNPNTDYTATDNATINFTSATQALISVGSAILVEVFGVLNSAQSQTVSAVSREIYSYSATTAKQAGVTVSAGYVQGQLNVFMNGLLLNPSTDFTATDGSTIVFSSSVASTIIVGTPIVVETFGTSGTTIPTLQELESGTGSQLVGYQPTFTNSVDRTVFAKLMEKPTLYDFGAKIDGATDDLNALNAYLAYYMSLTENNAQSQKFIYVDIPPGVMVISAPPTNTGGYNIMIAGKGQLVSTIMMKSGGTGIWAHGTTGTEAAGIFQLRDITLLDGNSAGSGVYALQLAFAEASTQSYDSITMENVEFRSFTQCVSIVDMPRNCYVNNVLCYGPDFSETNGTFTSKNAFDISTTSASLFGNFTWVWTKVMITNYYWGWNISSITPCEGHRWYSCTCYNGWGMIRANMSNTANGAAAGAYQPPIWYINDCDWQGLGFALDLANVRNVIVNNGFYFPNVLNPSYYSTIPNDPLGNSRTHRSIFSFTGNSGNITLRNVEFDNSTAQYVFNSTDTVVYVGSAVSNFRAYDTVFLAPAACLAAFEYQAGGNSVRCAAMNSQWSEWGGTLKILDWSNNQVNQEAVNDRAGSVYHGDANVSGLYSMHGIMSNATANSSNQVTVTFPTRIAYSSSTSSVTTAPIFIGGTPVVNFNVLNGTGAASVAVTLVSVSTTGFTFEYSGTSSEYQADVHWTATGY